ncbi:MAG: hypothetical protein R6V04_06680 [bacterium]
MNNKKNQHMDQYKYYFKHLQYENTKYCPHAELLQEYVNNTLSKRKTKKIEEHLNFCPFCLEAVQSLLSSQEIKQQKQEPLKNWNTIEKKLDNTFYTALDSLKSNKQESKKIFYRKSYFNFIKEKLQELINNLIPRKVLAYAGSLAVILIICIYSIAFFSRSDNFYLAEIEPEKQNIFRTRIKSDSFLAKGIQSFNQKNYIEAIEQFNKFLEKNPENYTANYFTGLSYLLLAKKGLPGLSYTYDSIKVNAGIDFLKLAVQHSDENKFYLEDCYWYLGKAYLMKENVSESRKFFKQIVNLPHPHLMRKDEAREIVSKLK